MKKILSFAAALLLAVNITPAAASADAPKLAALTFDDGPHAVYTEQLLDGLKERGTPVTFFFLGQCAEQNPGLVRRAYEEGHEIGCHTWSHPDLKQLSDDKIRSQFSRCRKLFAELLGEGNSYLVRPPYGSTDRRVRSAMDAVGVFWSVDTLDWKSKDEEKVYQSIVSQTRDGSIILCHDIHKTTVPAALRAVDTLQAQGYEFVTVSELLRRRGVEPVKGKLYSSCKPGGPDPGPIPVPVISLETLSEGRGTVTIESDAPVYYTTDGSCPDGTSKRYTGPFVVEEGTEVQAVAAWRLNGSRSRVSSARWEQPPAVRTTAGEDIRVLPTQPGRSIPDLHAAAAWMLLLPVAALDVHARRKAVHRRRRRPRIRWEDAE